MDPRSRWLGGLNEQVQHPIDQVLHLLIETAGFFSVFLDESFGNFEIDEFVELSVVFDGGLGNEERARSGFKCYLILVVA